MLCSILLQLGQGLFDAADGFDKEVFAGGVAEADASVISEGAAHYGGHVGLVEEIECHIGAVFYLFAIEGLAIVGAGIGEEVEGTLRQAHLEAGDFAEELVDQVATTLEGVAHIDNVFRGLGVHQHSADGGLLGYGAGGAGHLTLQLVGINSLTVSLADCKSFY